MAANSGSRRWINGAVTQVTKTNFSAAVQQIKKHIEEADFIAISTSKTGDFSSSSSSSSSLRRSWRRILPIDTPDTAYLKAKVSAESFDLFQFQVCPFRLNGSKVQAFPYNFYLFPRDELNLGMPSYSFSCQTSFLTSMAQEGFDFNVCIYDGISYLSRMQESSVKERNTAPRMCSVASFSSLSVADLLFKERIKSRIEHWRKACKDQGNSTDALVKTLKKLILGSEIYGSRPCMSIDICSDRQVQLVFDVVSQIGDDVVAVAAPVRSGAAKAVRVVLTSSEEDNKLLKNEIQSLQDEENLKIRGFREVIELISSSHKPIVSYNSLHDFAFIHSKFLAPLPPSLTEFMCSLRLVFPNILDVNHLSKEVGPLRKAKNLPSTFSYLKRQFFVPIELEIPQQADEGNDTKNHGYNVLRITSLFAKLSHILKLTPGCQTTLRQHKKSIEDYANIFHPTCTSLQEHGDESTDNLLDNAKRELRTDNLVFLWGFGARVSSAELKHCIQRIHHPALSEGFTVQLLDKTCAVVFFWNPGSATTFLKGMESGETLKEMMSEGLKGAGYEAYEKVCRLGLWETDLADSLDVVLSEQEYGNDHSVSCGQDASEIYWNNELMINLNDL